MTASTNPPAQLPPRLAAVHAWVRAQSWLMRFTLMNRVLLAVAFLPTGLVKATGQRFTQLPLDNPVGFFFEAMYRTGPYWHFIGGMQILASVLLLIPRTALLGALLCAPISVSILLITYGIQFSGTVYIAAGMVLSVTYLIAWDGDRVWRALGVVLGRSRRMHLFANMHWVETSGWLLGAGAGMGFFLVTRGFLRPALGAPIFWIGLGGIALVILGWALGARARFRSTGSGPSGSE